MGKPIGKNHLQKIVPIRLSVDDWERIKKEAQRMGIGVSTLTRIWVMDSLDKLAKGKLSDVRKK